MRKWITAFLFAFILTAPLSVLAQWPNTGTGCRSNCTFTGTMNVTTGPLTLTNNGIANTPTNGLALVNTTASTSGVPAQYAPNFQLQGTHWTGSVSEAIGFKMELQGLSGTAPNGNVVFATQNGAGAFTNYFSIPANTSSLNNNNGILIYTNSQVGTCVTIAHLIHNSGRGACLMFGDSQPIVIGNANPANGYVRVLNNSTTGAHAYDVRESTNTTNYWYVTNGVAATGTQMSFAQNTPPTCPTNCGTSPTVVGGDSAGIVTMGATGAPASGWVLTFNGTWAAAPSCTVQSALTSMVVGKMPIAVQTTTTTATVTTNGTAPANSDKYAYHCFGVQ